MAPKATYVPERVSFVDIVKAKENDNYNDQTFFFVVPIAKFDYRHVYFRICINNSVPTRKFLSVPNVFVYVLPRADIDLSCII